MLSYPRNTTLYAIAGTKTFRLGSRALFGKSPNEVGGNLQNIEKSLRRIYIPDEGKILIQVDQSGAEALIVSYLCEPGNYRDLFIHNIKPHVFVALHMFADKWMTKFEPMHVALALKTPIKELKSLAFWPGLESLIKESDKWPARERYYFIAKMVVHASSYGMTANTFQLNVLEKSRGAVNLPKSECERLLNLFHTLFPEIRKWHHVVEEEVRSTKFLRNLFGYPREFTTVLSNSEMKEAYAFIPQSTVGCITNIAFTVLQEIIEEENLDLDLLANTHDSYLAQAPIGDEEVYARLMKDIMEQELISPRGEKFKMKAESHIGTDWSKC